MSLQPNPTAGPSHLPLSLSVSHRDASHTLYPKKSDHQSLTEGERLKAARLRQTERWVDMLMETKGVELKRLKRSSIFLQPSHYQQITHERHLTSLCSYPPCSKPPSRPFSSAPIYRIISLPSTSAHPQLRSKKQDLIKLEGNHDDGYCSPQCRARSKWFERGLREEPVWVREFEGGEEGKRKWGIGDLLEDLERRGEWRFDEGGEGGPVTPSGLETGAGVGVEAKGRPTRTGTNGNPRKIIDEEIDIPPTVQIRSGAHITDDLTPSELAMHTKAILPPPIAPSDPLIPASADPELNELIGNLKIIEHPTPLHPPLPPSLAPSQSTPTKPTNTSTQIKSSPKRPTPSAKSHEASRRAYLSSSALAPISSDLSGEVIAASKENAEGFVVAQHVTGALRGGRGSVGGKGQEAVVGEWGGMEDDEEGETEEMMEVWEEMGRVREELKGLQEA